VVGLRLSFLASAAFALSLLGVAPAVAEPSLRWPPPMQLMPIEDEGGLASDLLKEDPVVDDWELREDTRSSKLPRIRLEANLRVMSVYSLKTKIGPAHTNHTVNPYRNAHLPVRPALGYRVLFDVKFTPDLVVGGFYTQLLIDGPRRHIHQTGIALGTVNLAPASRVRTSIDIQWADVFVRYVARDSERLRFLVGIGGAWASFRIRLTGYAAGAKGRVESFFAPSFGYLLQVRLVDRLHVFLESTTVLLSVDKFPAYYSDTRFGFRVPLGHELEFMIALSLSSGQLEDLDDLWGGKRVRAGHRWKQASWSAVGADIGLALRW